MPADADTSDLITFKPNGLASTAMIATLQGTLKGRDALLAWTLLVLTHTIQFCLTLGSINTYFVSLVQGNSTDFSWGSTFDAHSVKLGAYPNRLTEIPDDWALASSTEPQETRKDFDEAAFVAWAVDVMERHPRVQYVGGCCGIRPSFIRALRARLGSDAIPQSAY